MIHLIKPNRFCPRYVLRMRLLSTLNMPSARIISSAKSSTYYTSEYDAFLKDTSDNYLHYDFRSNAAKSNSIMLTCEHAGHELPSNLDIKGFKKISLNKENRHWTYDAGAAALTLELGSKLQCQVVLSRLSRLYIDVNRPLTSDTLFRKNCLCDINGKLEDVKVDFNQDIDRNVDEQRRRVMEYYLPYYWKLRDVLLDQQKTKDKVSKLVSLHSYTHKYEGNIREVESGILYSLDQSLAEEVFNGLASDFYQHLDPDSLKKVLRYNEPWSGQNGITHAIDCLRFASASTTGSKPLRNVMLEFRNDLLCNDVWRGILVNSLAKIFQA